MKAFGTVAVVLVLAIVARYWWIEPADIGEMCRSVGAPFYCTMRAGLILTFAFNGLGYASVVVGVLALFIRRTGLAVLGASLGAAGLVLYCYDFAAVGFALSMLTLARKYAPHRDEAGHDHSEREQHA